mmetsp:Transcript_11293/g.22502  ORF Transcript_11293/g.22502 Transcript_11293/m.22502 type:complete len:249 (-) Transcript_11293:441-1187(-)
MCLDCSIRVFSLSRGIGWVSDQCGVASFESLPLSLASFLKTPGPECVLKQESAATFRPVTSASHSCSLELAASIKFCILFAKGSAKKVSNPELSSRVRNTSCSMFQYMSFSWRFSVCPWRRWEISWPRTIPSSSSVTLSLLMRLLWTKIFLGARSLTNALGYGLSMTMYVQSPLHILSFVIQWSSSCSILRRVSLSIFLGDAFRRASSSASFFLLEFTLASQNNRAPCTMRDPTCSTLLCTSSLRLCM